MIRPYLESDKNAVLALFMKNTPQFFEPAEIDDLSSYLDNEREDYFVFEENQQILGAGGINYGVDTDDSARLSWDAISPEHHGKGIGSRLVQHRLDVLRQVNTIQRVIVRTSQFAHSFYAKQGFDLDEIKNDYWAKGYHLYTMSRELK